MRYSLLVFQPLAHSANLRIKRFEIRAYFPETLSLRLDGPRGRSDAGMCLPGLVGFPRYKPGQSSVIRKKPLTGSASLEKAPTLLVSLFGQPLPSKVLKFR